MPQVTATAQFKVAAPPGPSISNVVVAGLGVNTSIVIVGSNFGSTPRPASITFSDTFNNWSANGTGSTVTMKISSWSATKIVIAGFAGAYGQGNYVAQPGDSYAIKIVGPNGKSASWSGSLPNPIPAPVSNTNLVLGRTSLSGSIASQLTGVTVAANAPAYSPGVGTVADITQFKSGALKLSQQYGAPAFVWELQLPPYDGSKTLYLVTVGRYNPFQAIPNLYSGTQWGFFLRAGFVNGAPVSVRSSIITPQNITGVAPGQYKMKITKISNINQSYGHGVKLFIELFAGSSSVVGDVKGTYTNQVYYVRQNGITVPFYLPTGVAMSSEGLRFVWRDPIGGVHSWYPNLQSVYNMPDGEVFFG